MVKSGGGRDPLLLTRLRRLFRCRMTFVSASLQYDPGSQPGLASSQHTKSLVASAEPARPYVATS